MIESKSVKALPNEENKIIGEYEQFGWILKSNQEINTSNSRLESRGNDLYSVTESKHYINLMFQRDTSLPNYSRLVELENEYWDIIQSEPIKVKYGLIWAILTFFGIVFWILPGAAIIAFRVWRIKSYKKDYAVWRERAERLPKIELECRQLLYI